MKKKLINLNDNKIFLTWVSRIINLLFLFLFTLLLSYVVETEIERESYMSKDLGIAAGISAISLYFLYDNNLKNSRAYLYKDILNMLFSSMGLLFVGVLYNKYHTFPFILVYLVSVAIHILLNYAFILYFKRKDLEYENICIFVVPFSIVLNILLIIFL